MPEKIRARLLDVETPLSLAEWRAMFKDVFDEETGKREKEEFGDPSVFGETGSQAAEGRNLAISIFLPPVALGFSVLVCILHLANVMTMLFGHPAIWTGCGITLAFSPPSFLTRRSSRGVCRILRKLATGMEGNALPSRDIQEANHMKKNPFFSVMPCVFLDIIRVRHARVLR